MFPIFEIISNLVFCEESLSFGDTFLCITGLKIYYFGVFFVLYEEISLLFVIYVVIFLPFCHLSFDFFHDVYDN